VEGFVTNANRVTGVIVNGKQISCNTVVVATGPWSKDTSDLLNLNIPVEPLKGEILRLKLKNGAIKHDLTDGLGSIYPKPDGLSWIGATEEWKGFDTQISECARNLLWGNASKIIPELNQAELVLQTACLRPVTPDWMPILGSAPGWENVFLNTGAGKKGILFGPAMGLATADLVDRGKSRIDVSAFSAGRFSELPSGN
jgi:glycine oxidase